MGEKSGEQSHSGRTIGIAVGLGVGIPCLVTVLVLLWVTIRHSRKMREEDEEHKDIDFNGDITFFSPSRKLSGSDTSQFQAGDETASSAFQSDSDLRAGAALPNMLYTPEIGFGNNSQETFSRTLNSVYGPSPVYPSTEKLKGPQFSQISSAASIRSGNTFNSSYLTGPGPFATPPRRGSHPYTQYNEDRRSSVSSTPSMPGGSGRGLGSEALADRRLGPDALADGYSTLGPPVAVGAQLHQLNEVPHPYQDLVGNESRQSIANSAAELDRESPRFQEAPEFPSNPPQSSTQHPYYAEARNRESTLHFENN